MSDAQKWLPRVITFASMIPGILLIAEDTAAAVAVGFTMLPVLAYLFYLGQMVVLRFIFNRPSCRFYALMGVREQTFMTGVRLGWLIAAAMWNTFAWYFWYVASSSGTVND